MGIFPLPRIVKLGGNSNCALGTLVGPTNDRRRSGLAGFPIINKKWLAKNNIEKELIIVVTLEVGHTREVGSP